MTRVKITSIHTIALLFPDEGLNLDSKHLLLFRCDFEAFNEMQGSPFQRDSDEFTSHIARIKWTTRRAMSLTHDIADVLTRPRSTFNLQDQLTTS